jgi:cathepsin L
MYSRLVALALTALAAQGKVLKDIENYTFEQFVTDFNHEFSAEEHSVRKGLFEAELTRVIEHNTANKGSWKETINKFSAFTPEEKKALLGHSKAVKQAHKPKNLKQLPKDFKLDEVSSLPTSVDWRNTPNTVTSVKDQGHCGSCWAFAATAVLESHVALNTGLLYDLSPQQIAMCAPNPDSCGGTGGCNGATAEIAFDYVAGMSGILEEYQLGYAAYQGTNSACGFESSGATPVATIDGFVQLPENNYTSLMNAIAKVGPVAVSVDASNWHSYSSGIFNGCNQEQPDINHAVTLVGYGEENGEKYWTVRNSWSPSYGEIGYIRVLRTDDDESNCGMDITPQDGTACEGETEPVKVCGTCGILYDSSYPTGSELA